MGVKSHLAPSPFADAARGLKCAHLSIRTHPAQEPLSPWAIPGCGWLPLNSHELRLPYLASRVDYKLLRGKNHLLVVSSKYMLMNYLIDKPKATERTGRLLPLFNIHNDDIQLTGEIPKSIGHLLK